MTHLSNRIDYLQIQNECLLAINAFKTTNSVNEWLKMNESLYDQIVIKPSGLPSIIDFHFDGHRYDGIKKFGYLYQTVRGVFD
jgi:hypothetical protein